MKTLLKTTAVAMILATSAYTPLALAKKTEPVAATSTGAVIPGLAIANIEGVKANSNAFKVAQTQRPTTYKSTIDAANTRAGALQTQLKPLVDKFEADRKATTPNQASLQQQYQTIQAFQQNGQQEINKMMEPVALSEAYVDEQIVEKLDAAIKGAAAKRSVSLVLTPDNVLFADNAYNLNQAILDELNVALPSANLVPPAGWQPRQVREQKAAQAAQAGTRGSATAPGGR